MSSDSIVMIIEWKIIAKGLLFSELSICKPYMSHNLYTWYNK